MLQSLKLQIKTETLEKNFYEKLTIVVIKKNMYKCFICQKIYITRLLAKVGFLKGPSGTYKQRNKLQEETVTDNVKF